jgi:hypothetical protein
MIVREGTDWAFYIFSHVVSWQEPLPCIRHRVKSIEVGDERETLAPLMTYDSL